MAGLCVLCGEKEIEVPSTDTCKNCYSSVLRWSHRDQDDIHRRTAQLGLYAKRMMIVGSSEDINNLKPRKVQLKAMPGKIKLKEFSRLKGPYKKPRKKS